MPEEVKEKLLEEKLMSIRDFSRPPLVAVLEISKKSIAPTSLFVTFRPDEILPLIKILPQKYLRRNMGDVVCYMAHKRKGITNEYEKIFVRGLREAIDMARGDYSMRLIVSRLVSTGNSPERKNIVTYEDSKVINFLEEKRREIGERTVPYLGLDMRIKFWLYNQHNANTNYDFFRRNRECKSTETNGLKKYRRKVEEEKNQIRSEEEEAHVISAISYYKDMDFNKVIAYGEAALRLNPNNALMNLLVGKSCEERADDYGRKEDMYKAYRYYKKYLELEPNGKNAAEIRERISEIVSIS